MLRERENAREIKRDICIVSTHMTTELNPSYPELHLQSTFARGLGRDFPFLPLHFLVALGVGVCSVLVALLVEMTWTLEDSGRVAQQFVTMIDKS